MTQVSSTRATPSAASRRRDAARHLLMPHQIRESLVVNTRPWNHNSALAGLQAALGAAIALPLCLISPWPHLAGVAALGTLAALFGRFAPKAGRGRIVLTCAAWLSFAVLVMSVASWLGAPVAVRLGLLALSCGFFFFVTNTGQFGPPGALIFVFAAAAAMGEVSSGDEVLLRTAATALAGGLAWAICVASERLRHEASPEAPHPIEAVRPLDHRLIAAARITIGSAVAIFATYAVGGAHPGWAALGALAVMQGTHLHINMNRAIQRMAGTVIGAGLVWFILVEEPSAWATIPLVVSLQFAIEIVIGANYAFGQIFITPMALLMSHLAASGAAPAGVDTAMVPERVFDTIIGAILGIIFAVIFSTLDDRLHLARHHAARAGKIGG